MEKKSYFLVLGEARTIFDAWTKRHEECDEVNKAWVIAEFGEPLDRVYRGTKLAGVVFDGDRKGWIKQERMKDGRMYQTPNGSTKVGKAFRALPSAPSSFTALGMGWRAPFLTTPGYYFDPQRDVLLAILPDGQTWGKESPSGMHPIPASDFCLIEEGRNPSAETMALLGWPPA